MQSDCGSETGIIPLAAFTVTSRPTSVREREGGSDRQRTGSRLMEEYMQRERQRGEVDVQSVCAGRVSGFRTREKC